MQYHEIFGQNSKFDHIRWFTQKLHVCDKLTANFFVTLGGKFSSMFQRAHWSSRVLCQFNISTWNSKRHQRNIELHLKRHSTALFLFSFFSLSYFDGVNKIMFPLLFDHIVMKLNRINHPLTHVLFPSEIIINAQLETTFIEIWSVDKSHIKSSSNKLAIDYYFYDYFYFDITHHLVFDKTMK